MHDGLLGAAFTVEVAFTVKAEFAEVAVLQEFLSMFSSLSIYCWGRCLADNSGAVYVSCGRENLAVCVFCLISNIGGAKTCARACVFAGGRIRLQQALGGLGSGSV